MLLEVVGFWGIICLVGFFVAEWKKRNVAIGFISAVLLVVLGLWLIAEPVQIQTGTTQYSSQSYFLNTSIANSSYIPLSGNVTQINVYTTINASFFNFNQTLGMVFTLLGVLASFKYAFNFRDGW